MDIEIPPAAAMGIARPPTLGTNVSSTPNVHSLLRLQVSCLIWNSLHNRCAIYENTLTVPVSKLLSILPTILPAKANQPGLSPQRSRGEANYLLRHHGAPVTQRSTHIPDSKSTADPVSLLSEIWWNRFL
jgi:hypothetical protein